LQKFTLFTISSIILLSIAINSYSQNEYSYENVEKISDSLYTNRKFDQLIKFSNKAIDLKIDTYQLRYRLAMTYFEKKNYLSAITNFEKANDLGYETQKMLENLYYSYFYTDRFEEANYTYSKLSVSRMERIRPLNNPFINTLNIESGSSFSNDETKNSNSADPVTGEFYSEQTFDKNSFLFNAGLSQLPFERFSIYYNYTYLNQKKENVISYSNEIVSNNYSQIQSQFYNRFDIYAGNGFVVSPAGRFIGVKENTYTANFDSSASLKNYFSVSDKENISDNFIISAMVSKFVSLFKLRINGSFSFLNEKHQSQIGFSGTYFPFGNKKFYSESDVTLHNQNSISNLVFTQLFGGMIAKNFYFEAYATFGKVNNFNEQNGYIVFNNSDVTTLKFGADLKYIISNNFNAYLIYLNQQRERNYNVYEISNNSIPVQTQILNYQKNTILAGLKFIF